MSYKKIPLADSQPIWKRFEASEQAQQLQTTASSPAETIAQLQQQSLFIDLSNFIAHALPMRESLWWCIVVLELRNSDWSELEKDTISRCRNWVLEPEEAKRRFIERRLKQLGHDCAVGWLAQAVFWNGSGSIVEADLPMVMPMDYLYAKGVAGAVNTAAVVPEWDGYLEYYQQATAIAIDIADGGRGDLSSN